MHDSLNYSTEEIATLFKAQKQFFKEGITRSYAFRKGQLHVLKATIQRHEEAIMTALKEDLHKSDFEAYATEIGIVYEEINLALKKLKSWMRPESVGTPLTLFPSSSKIYKDPLGMVLIISPWNYPFNLLMAPLVAAIAGGNTVLLKPSELAPATAAVVTSIISETFEEDFIAVINGPGEKVVSEIILPYHLDHILFTGSMAVGKKIMEAAAQQLTPVTLELGGKCPCIVAADARLDYTAKKIAWSKWINAGQTCVAPDYLLVHESIKDKLVEKLITVTRQMFGSNPQQAEDYPRMINQKRFQTVTGYLQNGKLLYGGEHNEADLYIAPTLLEPAGIDSPIMRDEIFGPLLPIISYATNEEALQKVEQNPYPLALYLFTESKETAAYFTNSIRFGGGCINNGLVHLANGNLPFGGVGYSGMGQYHGRAGFDTFTRKKSMVKSRSWFDLPVWYAPFKNKVQLLRKLMK